MSAIQWALGNDGITIPAYLEQRRDTAHRFAVAQTKKTARTEVFEQIFGGDPPRGVIEVNQDVSAEYDVETAMQTRATGLNQIGRSETSRLAQIFENAPPLISQIDKIPGYDLRRQTHQGALAKKALPGGLHDPRINV